MGGNRRTSGAFVMLLHSVMNSGAWHDLSGNAVKVMLQLMKLSGGNNGYGHGKAEPGQLFLSERDAAIAVGISRNTASKALQELIEHGFLQIVKAGHFRLKVRHATVWRLTFQPYPLAHRGPTNEWRDWKPEQNSRAQKLNGSGPEVEPLPSEGAVTGAIIGAVRTENGAKQPNAIGSIIAPHIDMPCEGFSPARAAISSSPLIHGDPFVVGAA